MRISNSFFGDASIPSESSDVEDEEDDEDSFSHKFLAIMFVNKVIFITTWFIDLVIPT